MQCQDLDLSKCGQISQLSEDLSEIKFSINRIIISNFHVFQKIAQIEQNSPNNIEPKTIALKLKFYSALSSCKLKQKLTRVSIFKNVSRPFDFCVLSLQKDAINLKVSFPTNQENQIMGKVYFYEEGKSQEQKSDKKLFGTFRINLLEWTKEMREQSGSSEHNNPQCLNLLKKVQLNLSTNLLQNQEEGSLNNQSSLVSGFKRGSSSQTIENSGFVSFDQQSISLQNFIEFKVINGEFVQNIFNNFQLESLQNLVPKQRRLKIVNSIIDEKIGKTSRIPYLTTRRSQFYLLPEKQILRNMNRAKTEVLLQPVSHQILQESTSRPVVQLPIKRQPKSFKEQIYELLQEVRHFQKNTKVEKQFLQRKVSISRINNLYFSMSAKRQDRIHLNIFSENTQIHKTVTEYDQLIPLSSVQKKSHSETNLSVLQNELQPSMSLIAKYNKMSRVQERLESFEKVRSLSNLKMFKLQENQEEPGKQMKHRRGITSLMDTNQNP